MKTNKESSWTYLCWFNVGFTSIK